MRANKRRRERTGSLSPPLRPSYEASGQPDALVSPPPALSPTPTTAAAAAAPLPPSPSTFIGLIQYRSSHLSSRLLDARQRQSFVMRHNLLHMQALQEVLRRTSLAEMRDREVVEWLLGTEKWLREFHQPLMAPQEGGSTSSSSTNNSGSLEGGSLNGGGGGPPYTSSSHANAGSSFAASAFPPGVAGDAVTRAYSSALSELRLLVIGVLHTMPWWRVVETVAKSHTGATAVQSGGSGGGPLAGGRSSKQVVHSGSGGGGAARKSVDGYGSAAAERAMAARHAITRWHVRLQIAFEKVCLLLIEKSQHTVRGVLEVLLKPCQLRPPVRDGARRSIPSDSFIRVLNAVATRYNASYVIDLLEGCIADFMPRRRWAERRHHVACTAALLYVALEGHTPAYNPRLGNAQSLQRAIELLKSLRSRAEAGVDGAAWRLPRATRSSSLTFGTATSEDSGTDAGGGIEKSQLDRNGENSSSATSGQHRRRHLPYTTSRQPLTSMLLPSGGVLPAGYVSATIQEDAHVGGGAGLRQPVLPRPGVSGASLLNTTTASDTELSDGAAPRTFTGLSGEGNGNSDSSSAASVLLGRARTQASSGGGGGGGSLHSVALGGSHVHVGDSGSATAAAAAGAGGGGGGSNTAHPSSTNLSDVSVEHNNKLLSYRNNIIRLLLNRLLDIEQTLEPREEEKEEEAGKWNGSRVHGSASMSYTSSHHRYGANGPSGGGAVHSPFSSAPPSGQASPASLVPTSTASAQTNTASFLFPSAPVFNAGQPVSVASGGLGTAASSALSSPAALSPAAVTTPQSYLMLPTHASSRHAQQASTQVSRMFGAGASPSLESFFSALSLPYLRILRDCATLVYGRLADDLRRQQAVGACGNADWWEEILFFYLTVVTRVERPVYLLYLAPSLAMLSTDDEPVNVLHKLITLVTKGSMPVEQPRLHTGAMGGGGGVGGMGSRASLAQPVRLRMPPPTGGSRRVVTMEERLRAARHIFPLFRFLRSRLDETSSEGLRRRLLKWTAQELRRLGGASQALSAHSSFGGNALLLRTRQTPSRESRLALVTFAQCAAISEVMEVDILPSAPEHGGSRPHRSRVGDGGTSAAASATTSVDAHGGHGGGSGNGGGGRFTATSASGDATDSMAAALQPLLARYTLHTEAPEEEMNEEGLLRNGQTSDEDSLEGGDSTNAEERRTKGQEEEEAEGQDVSDGESATSSSSRKSPRRAVLSSRLEKETPVVRRRLDLRQMEYEGLLQPQLMANCPWQAWLR